jgi:CubicO group peptidase (beta-lactamase class C family)
MNDQVKSRLRDMIEEACADQKTGIPGATAVVVGEDGNELFSHSAGKRGIVSNEPMVQDSIFWIASCTKMLVGLACMQLVEKGVLKLDDGHQTEELAPELKSLKVLRPGGTCEEKKKSITLRMLLSHTAGFGYTFFNERLREWSYPVGVDEFSGRIEDIVHMPLLFQPGEGWEYGVSMQFTNCRNTPLTTLSIGRYRLGRNSAGAGNWFEARCLSPEACHTAPWHN